MGDIVEEMQEQQKHPKTEKLAEDVEAIRLEIELAELRGVRDKPAELKAKEFELATWEAELDEWVALVEWVVADIEGNSILLTWESQGMKARWAERNKSKGVRNDGHTGIEK